MKSNAVRKIVLCLVIASLPLSGCGRKADTGPDTVNIMCRDGQAEEIYLLFLKSSGGDNSLTEPNFITEKDFESYEEWYDALHKSLLTHDPDIDIYYLDSLDEYAYKIIQDHYYVDLSQDEVLTQNFDAMYPEVKRWCSYGDEIFGFPFSMEWLMAIYVDEAQTGEIGYDMQDFDAADGLIDFCREWEERKATPPTEVFMFAYRYWINYALTHYDRDTGELNLDNPEFRAILTQCRELSRTEAVFAEPTPETIRSTQVTCTSPVLLWGVTGILRYDPQYTPVPYPLLPGEDAQAKRQAYMTWLLVNPYSKKTDEALRFMRCLTGWADTRDIPIYGDIGAYPEDWYTQEQLDTVGVLLKRMDVGLCFPGFNEVLSACDNYMEGTVTLDEAIAEAQRILDTVQKEQYIDQ